MPNTPDAYLYTNGDQRGVSLDWRSPTELAEGTVCTPLFTINGETSDGYHTFNELYAHRVRLFSTLMRAYPEKAWWSRNHSDGSSWKGWIIAGITTGGGEVTYHLPESEIPYLPDNTELELGKPWDGHTSDDVLVRLVSL